VADSGVLRGGPAALVIDAANQRVAASLARIRSHAARRAGSELCVPAPPRRLTSTRRRPEIVRPSSRSRESGRLPALTRGFADLSGFAYDALARGDDLGRRLAIARVGECPSSRSCTRCARVPRLPGGREPRSARLARLHRWDLPGSLLTWIEAAHDRCVRARRWRGSGDLIASSSRRRSGVFRLHERSRESQERPRPHGSGAAETLLIHRDRVPRRAQRAALPIRPIRPARSNRLDLARRQETPRRSSGGRRLGAAAAMRCAERPGADDRPLGAAPAGRKKPGPICASAAPIGSCEALGPSSGAGLAASGKAPRGQPRPIRRPRIAPARPPARARLPGDPPAHLPHLRGGPS
jgi:hypothetical protein